MSTLKLDEPLKSFEGTEIRFAGEEKPQTLRALLIHSVLTGGADKLDGVQKYERYEFAKRLKDADNETDWTIEDLKTLKDAVGLVQMFGVIVVGALFDALEGK